MKALSTCASVLGLLGLLVAVVPVGGCGGAPGEGDPCSPADGVAHCGSDENAHKLYACKGSNPAGEGTMSLVEDCKAKNLLCSFEVGPGAKTIDKCITKEELCKRNITPRPPECG